MAFQNKKINGYFLFLFMSILIVNVDVADVVGNTLIESNYHFSSKTLLSAFHPFCLKYLLHSNIKLQEREIPI